jgi:iron complex outermembrane recepter protein
MLLKHHPLFYYIRKGGEKNNGGDRVMLVRMAAVLMVSVLAATTLFAQEQVKQDQGDIRTEATITVQESLVTKPATTATQPESIVTKPVATAQKLEAGQEKSDFKSKQTSATKDVSMKEVVVTATRSEKDISDSPAPVSVVTRKEMEKRNVKSIDEAVNTLPGVFNPRLIKGGMMDSLPNGGISLGGFGRANKTLTLFNGMTLNDAYSGSQRSMLAFDPEDVERIEVVKGPFSSLYGGYAMGGVLNIIPRMPEKLEFVLKNGYGSSWHRGEAPDDTKRLYFSYGDKLWDKLSVFFSYKLQDTNGYIRDEQFNSTNPSGTFGARPILSNTGTLRYLIGDRGAMTWKDDKLTARVGYSFSENAKINLSVTSWSFKYDFGAPHSYLTNTAGTTVYLPREASYVSPSGGKSEFLEQIYTLSYEQQLGLLKSKLSLGLIDRPKSWNITADTTYALLSGLSSGATVSAGKISDSTGQSYNADLQFMLPVGQSQILIFGSSFLGGSSKSRRHLLTNWKDENSKADLDFEGKGRYRMVSAYMQDEIAILSNLSVYPSLRYDWWQGYDGAYYDRGSGYIKSYGSADFDNVSPKFALVYHPYEKTTLRTSVGTAFRPPTLYEMYSASITSASLTEGNPDLKPEKTLSWNAGIQQTLWKGGKVEATYFENYITDLIQNVAYGMEPGGTGRTLNKQQNVGKAQNRGVEIGITQKFDQWLNLFANYTFMKTRITNNDANPALVGKEMIMAPRDMFNVGGDATYGPLTFSLTGSYVGKRYNADLNNDTVNHVYGSYDPYFIANTKISYEFTKYSALSLSVDNILNKNYYCYYKAPGRSWFAELTVKF